MNKNSPSDLGCVPSPQWGGHHRSCYRCFGKMCRGGAHRGCAGEVVEDTHTRGSKRCMHRPRAMSPEVIVAGNDCRDARPPTAGGNWAQQEEALR